MKLTDFVATFLANLNIDTVFGVTGGAAVHLFDSACNQNIKCIFTHHEQAAAFAAQAYARINGIGAAFFTTGPGGTNAVTGVAAAWLDSIPTIYIGGQVRRSHMKPLDIRQQGTQELDVVGVLSSIVKYATTLTDPTQIKYELEKCLYTATSGRPGPVYLEIPLDLQWAEVELAELPSYTPDIEGELKEVSNEMIQDILEKLYKAKKPLILLGHGIRLANAQTELDEFLKGAKIPYLSSWNATDLVDCEDTLNLGRPGMFGCRGANLAIQACDFLCCLGTHLSSSLTTGDFKNFARQAEIAVVNIDKNELKHQRVDVKYPLNCNVKRFLKVALSHIPKKRQEIDDWRKKCEHLRDSYSLDLNYKQPESNTVDAYEALARLNAYLSSSDSIVVDGGGTIVQIAFQSLRIKKGQRLVIDAGLCSMGSGLPQALGVFCARKNGNIICLCGDGSFQFNVHELQTIYHHKMPVKLFIFNNSGYLSIRHTQGGFLGSRFIGSSEEGGISVPDILAVASAYKIPSIRVNSIDEMDKAVQETLKIEGPALCEIMVPAGQEIRPRIGFDELEKGRFVARPIEDMSPYLSREELKAILN